MYKIINFKKFTDGRGSLIPLECGSTYQDADIPFDVKRSYFISAPTNDNDAVRGKHAHKNLQQVIIAAHGSFTLDLEDGKGNKQSIELSDVSSGVYIRGLIWRELKNFSKDCVILVFASEHYDESDYIRDYDQFLKISQGSN